MASPSMKVSLQELIESSGLDDATLDKEVEEKKFYELSHYLTQWELIALQLDVSEADVETIERKRVEMQGVTFLKIWKQRNAFKSTYRALVVALLSIGQAANASGVCQILKVEEDVIQEARTDNIDGSVVSTHQINGEDVLQGATAVNSNITIEDIKCLANDPKTLEKIESAKKFKFIVIGQTGIGKSTLINGLIGAEVAKVDEGLTTGGTTTEVESYTKKIENIEVVAYDSPGLEHGLGEDIYQTCREGAHLVIFAIPTTGKRFVPNNPDALTIVKFTRKLTPAIWKKTLVVLTQANTCETLNPHLRNKSKENKKEFFIRLVCDYKTAIHQTLKTTGVPAATVEKVKVVPVGHEYEPELLDGTLWFTNFWFECLTAIPTAEGRIAMTRVNILRFKSLNDVTDKDFQQSVHNQPIVVVRPKMTADDTVSIFVGSPAAGALALRFTDDAIELVTMPTGFKMGMVLGTIIL